MEKSKKLQAAGTYRVSDLFSPVLMTQPSSSALAWKGKHTYSQLDENRRKTR